MNTLIIRADATSEIGTGHVMRCLALAQAWLDQGGEVAFISHCESDALGKRITAEGINLISLDKPHPDPFDLDFTINTLNKLKAQNSTRKTWLVVDGYHFDADYQKSIKAAGFKLLWIHDYGHAEHYYADLVLNQNISADPYYYKHREPSTQLLMGTRYALVRREFKRWQGYQREITPRARKVLVTLGGADPDNVTLKVIQALKHVDAAGLEAKIVIGPANPHVELLKKEIGGDSRLHLFTNVADMSDLMAWADVSISAGGSTCWEQAFMGLPGLIIILADNQQPVGQWLGQSGIGVNLGWHASVSPERIARETFKLLTSHGIRKEMTLKGQVLVDGEGAARVLMLLKEQRLRLRRVRDNDCQLLWRWANEPGVRKAAFSTAAIPWEDHLQWFYHKRSDPHVLQYIAVNEGDRLVGQVRFDLTDGETAEIDVSLAEESRGLGYGRLILDLAAEELFRTTEVKSIHSFIKVDNLKSIKTFEKAGYKQVKVVNRQGEAALHYIREKNEITNQDLHNIFHQCKNK
jgi:UDP-2,4-diacetamido-2,4,6-trideoxy-beta-L-altropyranose hydrolase